MRDTSRGEMGTEERARAFLEQLRWPYGIRCPRCDRATGISRLATRGQFECEGCGYHFSVRVGTVLHGSRLPLSKWVLAVYLMTESEVGITANQLGQMLGVSYKTAWFLSHRIRIAMRDEAGNLIMAEPYGDGIPQQRMALLRRAVVNAHRWPDDKHLAAYLDEAAFRIAHRDDEHRFHDTLVRLLQSDAVPYAELTAER
jgi:transposase-like protein